MENDDIMFAYAHARGRMAAHMMILKALLMHLEDDLVNDILNILEESPPEVPLPAYLELGPGISDVIRQGYQAELNNFRQDLGQVE